MVARKLPAIAKTTRYVAFLRAINVGGHTVKMVDLRKHFEDVGLADVATFIASGNVIFSAGGNESTLVRKIEQHLHASLGYEVVTFLRSCSELATVAARDPFAQVEPGPADRLHIGFLREAPSAAAQRHLLGLATDDDHLAIEGRELYWLRRGLLSEAAFTGAALEKRLGAPLTLRNANTVQKLAAKYPMERATA